MTHSADFQEISILIPGYSIEDLPSDLNERNAASLLNAFAVAWHPWLLHRSARIPEFRQAESTELPTGQHLILVPECSEDWLGHDWQEKLSDTLSVVFHGCGDRDEWTKAIDDEFGVAAEAIPESLLADFFALGTTHLQVLLLSRRMHHFVDPDGHLLESEAFAAAEAAITGDEAKAQDHLRRCFECLLDCREQFYPVDCFLVDMCLPSDQTMAADLQSLISESPSLSLVCSSVDSACRNSGIRADLCNSQGCHATANAFNNDAAFRSFRSDGRSSIEYPGIRIEISWKSALWVMLPVRSVFVGECVVIGNVECCDPAVSRFCQQV